jgi:hypothetical protein
MPLRYVVLRHEGFGEPHFDLMIEDVRGGQLLTWRSPAWPPVDGTKLTPLAAHRRAYLDYEGPLSGGRGSVRRVDQGECETWRESKSLIVRFHVPLDQIWEISEDSIVRARGGER